MRVIKWIVSSNKPNALDEVFAAYQKHYESRFYRKVKGLKLQQTIRDNLAVVVGRVGKEEAIRAIRILLTSPRLRWVCTSPDVFLSNETNYERHIVPAMADEREAGEQAEWSGDRDETPGSKVVSPEDFLGHGRLR